MKELTSAIFQVISSPYAISLKNLDSAIRSTSQINLQRWADSYPCQISALAGAITNALEFCPYALHVVEGFGRVTAVRDAMLREKATLLDGLLRSAKQNENSFEKYSPACLSLLSSPLPLEFGPPALLVQFFLRTVEIATKKPNKNSVKSIYTLVSNGYGHLTELLISAQKIQLRDRMAAFISTADRSVILLALATLACIGNVLDKDDDVSTSISSEDHRHTRGNKDFFHGKKAIKLLQLTTNIAIDLASKDPSDCEDILEELRLATVIVSTVGNEVKESLATCNDTLNTPKILEKLKRPGLSEAVLKELLVFSTALFPQKSPMPGLAEFLKSLSQRPVQDRKYQGSTFPSLVMAKTISSNTLPSQEQISDIVLASLNMASSPPPIHYRTLTNLKDLTNFIRPLAGLIPQSQQLQNNILSSLATDEVSRLMLAFLSANNHRLSYTCSDCEVCPTRVLDLQKELSLGLCMLLLRAGIYTRDREHVGLEPELANALLEKQLQLSVKEEPCSTQYFSQSELKSRNTITLFEASSTPENRVNSHNWRHRLYNTLQGDANRQHESIIAVMGEICRDLETRCEGVERPLYEEVERSKGLRREIDQLRAKLEHEVQERLSVVEAFESLGQEKDDLERNLEDAVAEAQKSLNESMNNAQNLETRVQELENLLRLSREETQGIRGETLEMINKLNIAHQSELHAAKIAADKLAVDHIATLNGQQEAIEILEGKNRILEQECKNLREQHESLGKEKSAANERIELLEKEISALTAELEVQRSAIARKNGEIETLEISLEEADEEEKELNKKISSLETKLETMESLVRRLGDKIGQVTEKSLQDSRKLEADHSSLVIQLKLVHEKEVQGLHAQIQKIKVNKNKERATHLAEKRNLMGRIDGLRAHQEQKAKEAETLARQLLGAMTKPSDFSGFFDGVTSDTAQEDTSKEQIVPVSSTTTTQPIMSTGRRRSSPADSLGSPSSSPTRNGSTPKRPKMRPTPTSPNQMQHRINFQLARTIPGRGKTTSVLNKEDHTTVGGDFVEETPTEIDAGLNQDQTLESNYGGTALFTSTPKLERGGPVHVGIIGSEYDGDDTTMDYSLGDLQ